MRTALVSIMADFEQPYIEEWLDYHFSIGFDDAWIFMNNWRSDLDTSRFVQNGNKVFLVPFDGTCQQLNAYNSFLGSVSSGYDFAAFIDCDEFIVLKQDSSITQFFDRYKDNYAIGLNWKLFGSNGHENVMNGNYSVIQRFTKSQNGINQHIKTILNLEKIRNDRIMGLQFINPHFTNYSYKTPFTITPEKDRYILGPFNKYGSDNTAYIAHYIIKSKEEFYIRRKHIRADTPTPRQDIENFLKEHDRNDIYNFDVIRVNINVKHK